MVGKHSNVADTLVFEGVSDDMRKNLNDAIK